MSDIEVNETLRHVLDHGFVRLVDYMGSDLSIVRNARVSYDAEWRAGQDSGSDERLINYLYSNGHNTPFEAVTFTFDVKAPIFVFRQWHRHAQYEIRVYAQAMLELIEPIVPVAVAAFKKRHESLFSAVL